MMPPLFPRAPLYCVILIMGTSRAKQGIIDLGFPRDRNDFFPARESVYAHNVRYIISPKGKDVRKFIK